MSRLISRLRCGNGDGKSLLLASKESKGFLLVGEVSSNKASLSEMFLSDSSGLKKIIPLG